MENSEETIKSVDQLEQRRRAILASRDRYRQIILERKNRTEERIRPRYIPVSKSIDEQIKAKQVEKAELENEEFGQNTKLKKLTLKLLFIFLASETAIIFTIAFFQGFKFVGFGLDKWSFDLIIFATITQITTMLLIAVKHLFPQKINQYK